MEKIWLKSYPPGVPAEIDPAEFSSLNADRRRRASRSSRTASAYVQMGRADHLSRARRALARDFAAWLQNEAGLQKGDRIAIMMPNVLQYPVAMFGALRAGLVVVNTNPLYTARELEHQLKDSGAKAIVILENFAHVLQEVIAHTELRKVLVTAVGDMLGSPKSWLVNFVVRHERKQVPPWNIRRRAAISRTRCAAGRRHALHAGRADA